MPQLRPTYWRGLIHRAFGNYSGAEASTTSCNRPRPRFPPEEDAVSIEAAIVLRDTFAKESLAVCALFAALVGLLTGDGRKH